MEVEDKAAFGPVFVSSDHRSIYIHMITRETRLVPEIVIGVIQESTVEYKSRVLSLGELVYPSTVL